MPIYEYECDSCGRIEEAFQKISDAPLSTCNHCSGKLHKLVSHSSFHLKGTGWYVTDYAKKTVKKTEDSSTSETKATGESKGTSDSGSSAADKKSTPE
ncbi:MAG: FmdB family zinc ribbon protein [Desulfobacterales bacterium]